MALPDLLQWVAAAGKTGVLSFNRHSITKRIFASEGRIIGSASNDPIDFIGQWLVSCGRISEDQLRIALGEHERSRTYIGTVLVQMRAISQEDLVRMLVLKTEEIIYTLFHWEDAGFEFAAGEMDAVAFQISLRVEDVLLKGVRRYDEIQRIRRVFPHSEVILRRTSLVPPPEVMQNPHARRILEAIDGLRSINAIALHAHASEFIVSKFLFELHQAGYAEIIAIPAPLATSGVTHRAEALVGTPGVSARVETIVSATTGVAARSSGAFPRAEAITGAGRLAGVGTSGAFPGGPYSSGAFAGGESLVATSGAYAKPDASVGTSGAYARPSADNADDILTTPRPALLSETPGPGGGLLTAAKTLIDNGNLDGALAILAKAPVAERDARLLKEKTELRLIEQIYREFLPRGETPTLTRPMSEITENLSAEECYLLSRIDGTWDIQSIVAISPLREIEALRALNRLRERGLIALR